MWLLKPIKTLADRATPSNLVESGIDNAAIMTRPLIEGYKKQAPYNVIIISGCVEEVPDSLLLQIADGGKLLAVVGSTEIQEGDGLPQIWEIDLLVRGFRGWNTCSSRI